MRWIEASVATKSAEIDTLCARLAALGVDGMCIEDEEDFKRFLENNKNYWGYVDEELHEKYAGRSRVKFYLPDDTEGQAQLENIRAALSHEIEIGYMDDQDWENAWKSAYEAIPVGEELIIVPEWLEPDTEGRTALRLEPGLAFGTGSHETTRIALLGLERYAKAGKKVLDLGCGSGILAIAALLLGCDSAVGCDIDTLAPKASMENAALNAIGEDRLKVYAGNILADEGMRRSLGENYEIVLANIVADVIVPLAGFVRRFMAPGGVFICSGILEDRCADVEKALSAAGFRILEHLSENEWNGYICV